MTQRIEKKVVVNNAQGLHARPAALFVQLANKFDSTVSVIKDDQQVNGKSIMGILMLAAEKGSEIILITEGHDAEEAMQVLGEMVGKDE